MAARSPRGAPDHGCGVLHFALHRVELLDEAERWRRPRRVRGLGVEEVAARMGPAPDLDDPPGRPNPEPSARPFDASPRAAGTPGAWPWAALLRRVFDFDVLTCPLCGSRLRVIATVQDPLAVQAILASLARSGTPAPPGPAPPAPAALT